MNDDKIIAVMAEALHDFEVGNARAAGLNVSSKPFSELPTQAQVSWMQRPTVILKALRAKGISLVELPDQMTDRSHVADVLRSLPMWTVGSAWTCLREPDLLEFEADSQQVFGEFSVRDARDLAAVLLAAADLAEKEGQP